MHIEIGANCYLLSCVVLIIRGVPVELFVNGAGVFGKNFAGTGTPLLIIQATAKFIRSGFQLRVFELNTLMLNGLYCTLIYTKQLMAWKHICCHSIHTRQA